MTKTCLNCRCTFSETDKACWNCMGMRYTRGVESSKCEICNTELYRHKTEHALYTNTCVLRSHFYCNKHDPICKDIKNIELTKQDEKKSKRVIKQWLIAEGRLPKGK